MNEGVRRTFRLAVLLSCSCLHGCAPASSSSPHARRTRRWSGCVRRSQRRRRRAEAVSSPTTPSSTSFRRRSGCGPPSSLSTSGGTPTERSCAGCSGRSLRCGACLLRPTRCASSVPSARSGSRTRNGPLNNRRGRSAFSPSRPSVRSSPTGSRATVNTRATTRWTACGASSTCPSGCPSRQPLPAGRHTPARPGRTGTGGGRILVRDQADRRAGELYLPEKSISR